ncbi:DUF1918 domain-containing protein [Nocardia cyriacigeorgica]|uniref:DUF1918 domain-containing protein n=1 Tax=Nocardia cyriacigeorgica TaxID=135487 RepID=A0A6P1CYT5_9NOCA|nr:DUF1918 domain-containing protein [Nocardia cyriacigeorgica]NEW43285.1 DUF1918 domain-containing protein [Nocardia cyriacigeorgica]NEW55021.1 DUF1918 domain-containing protein [Nocardia cyriacigeorgica]
MYAKVGDWLVVECRNVGGAVRRGLIEQVQGKDGAPPYLVHWADNGHRALTFPGPDAHVLTSDELHAAEEITTSHFTSALDPSVLRSTDTGKLAE